MKPIQLAYLNLTRRKLSTVVGILAIAIAVACSGILLRLNHLAESRFNTFGAGGDVLIGAKTGGIEMVLNALNSEGDYPQYLPVKLFESLRAGATIHFEDGASQDSRSIRSVIPFIYVGKIQENKVLATDESFLSRPRNMDSMNFLEGRWAQNSEEIVLGSLLAEKLKKKTGDSLEMAGWLGDVSSNYKKSLKVVGIFQAKNNNWDRLGYVNLATAQEVLISGDLSKVSTWGSGVLHYFLTYLHPGGLNSLKSLVNDRTVGQVVEVDAEIYRLKELVGSGKSLGLFVTVLVLLLGGLSVLAMLITRFDAMSLQMAMLRAIGYGKSEITSWLLWEGVMMGAIAVVLGMILDALCFPMIREILGSSLPSAELLQSPLFLSYPVWLAALVATTLSVVVPLVRIYKQDVHFSLRA
ncbi:hypothetical protein BDW_01180 [Bdellovibrio bacteriovorus W]|nr:hypothetical protein BDW_01180 [Bdellovibrio bacteriovorus W]